MISATAIGIALGWAAENALDAGADWVKGRLRNRNAEAELVSITGEAVEAAIQRLPALAEDLRSTAFLNTVVGPAALDRVQNPAADTDPAELASRYIERFVARWGGSDVDGALMRLLDADRAALTSAMAAFVETFRAKTLASANWRDVGRDRTLEAIHTQVTLLVERETTVEAASVVTVQTARDDARAGSSQLLAWRRDTAGAVIERPELDRLLQRIRTAPRGRTLVIGEGGSGKSALLSQLTEILQGEGMTVIGLKADLIPPETETVEALSAHLKLHGGLDKDLEVLAQAGPVVLIIDQLDAVSELMDQSSNRMNLLLGLALSFSDDEQVQASAPVHVVLSSRPFEAAHDARFQALEAEEVLLALPSTKDVEDLLREVGLNPSDTPPGLKETIRRPFALRLYVELSQAGGAAGLATPSELFRSWLMAKMPDSAVRAEADAFLEGLAREMTETETLWRPADVFDLQNGAAVIACEAAGLIVRQDGQIGFSHQSWLDDFQARGFRNAQSVADFAWARQDGLFARATVLRALERLRRHQPDAYDGALDLLLSDGRTRRHIKYLVIDLVGGQAAPRPREIGWVCTLVTQDAPLARRALGRIAERWGGWREGLSGLLPQLMADETLQWVSTSLLHAESRLPESETLSLITREWPDAEHDTLVFDVMVRSPLWSSRIRTRFEALAARSEPNDAFISLWVENLINADRAADAAEVVSAWLKHISSASVRRPTLYRLDKLAHATPIAFAQSITPWVLEMTAPGEDDRGRFGGYPSSDTWPARWEIEGDEDNLVNAYRAALAEAARLDQEAARPLLDQLIAIGSEEAQSLVAEAYAAAPKAFAQEAMAFLRDDARRFDLGETQYDDGTGCSRTLYGYTSQNLVKAIAPALGADDRDELLALIRRWDRYPDAMFPDDDVKLRRERRGWAEEARRELLFVLPREMLDVRTIRVLEEWMATQPPRHFGRIKAHTVGSPMSTEQMARASNEDVVRLLDECPDGSDWGNRRSPRPISQSGGAIQAGRAFGALAKTDPERIIGLLRGELSPDAHQGAAGNALYELSQLDSVEAQVICDLVAELDQAGFTSDTFRHQAAWALERAAHRSPKGLGEREVSLLNSWLTDDPERIRRETLQRAAAAERNRGRQSPREPRAAASVLFGRRGGGLALPLGNYTYLAALAAGLLRRPTPDHDGWLEVLETHLGHAEHTEVWRAVLAYWGQNLFWADRERAQALLRALWTERPDAFDIDVIGMLYSVRPIMPADLETALVEHWLAGLDEQAQAAGEYLGALHALAAEDDPLQALAQSVADGEPGPARTGLLFGSAAVWRGDGGRGRRRAHAVLKRFAPEADGDEAVAIGSALSAGRRLPGDAITRELLQLSLDKPKILEAAIGPRFGTALQVLLLQPGFEDLVLEIVETTATPGEPHKQRFSVDKDFVAIAIAVQRNDGPRRARAMDLYERMLDAAVYGAAEAAADALRA